MLTLDGSKLRRAREDAELSVEDVALAVDRTVSTVFKWETNRANPPTAVVNELVRVLKVEYTALCDDRHPTVEAADEAKRSLDDWIAGVVSLAADLTPCQRARLALLFPAPSAPTNGPRRAAA